MPEIIRGTVTRLRFQNPDSPWSIGTIECDDGEHTFVGPILAIVDDFMELTGSWSDNPKFGKEFKVAAGIARMDERPDALVHMIANNRDFEGIGKVKAERLVKAALELGDGNMGNGLDSPEAVASAANLPVALVRAAAKVWNEERERYDALAALVSQGWTSGQAGTIVYYMGAGAPLMIRADPYGLIGKIPRFGFRTVDTVALNMGLAKTDTRRMQSGVAYCLDQIASQGNTWTTREGLLDEALKELRPDTLDAEDLVFDALAELTSAGLVHRDTSPLGTDLVADAYIAGVEFDVFDRLLEGLGDPSLDKLSSDGPRTQAALEPLNAGQSEALLASTVWPVTVISGAGGTGKTFTMRAICEMMEENGLSVALCAPTGKAARKLGTSTRRKASTIHRLLEPKFDERTGGFKFLRDAGNPIQDDVVVVDEVSMCDVKLMQSLLRALPPECRLLLVGDHNQIPPIGAGAILRDLLAARDKFSTAIHVLTEIVRQAGDLAVNTRTILDGFVPPPVKGSVTWQIHRTERGHEQGAAAMAAQIVEMVVTAPEPLRPFDRFLDLDWDVQVLAPMRKGPLGTYALNVHLQKLRQRLLGNPPPEPTPENKKPKVLLGDRVIWTKNDYELNLFNGTQAVVIGIQSGSLTLYTDEGREVIIPPGKRDRIEVSYAMTIHKAQGSEWPFVLLCASSSHWIMHDRNLLYTGASRASESLMILGDATGIAHFAAEKKTERRQTFGAFLVHGWTPSMQLPQLVAVDLD
tara:strand:- start:14377 stop:16632 length:2256 start_codon:yes stop_codon:yes gene_type:complete